MRTLLLLFLSACLSPVYGQTESAPAVPDYGVVWDLDDVVKPDPDLEYRILIDLKARSDTPSAINGGLDRLARMINLHVTGGVPAANLDVVVAIHGGATPVIMDNKGYNQHFGVDNPNLDLINQLEKAGVRFYVCGQSLIKRKYGLDNVTSGVEISLSMLTLTTEHLMKGYGMMVFD